MLIEAGFMLKHKVIIKRVAMPPLVLAVTAL
jgi:hypothetical protein